MTFIVSVAGPLLQQEFSRWNSPGASVRVVRPSLFVSQKSSADITGRRAGATARLCSLRYLLFNLCDFRM